MSGYAHPELLVTTDWVKENLGKSGIKLVEVDVDTKAYDAGHIQGAIGFNWHTQLQDQVSRDILSKGGVRAADRRRRNLEQRHRGVLRRQQQLVRRLRPAGCSRIYGHREVRLMDGGRVKWLNEADKQLTTEPTRVTPVRYTASSPDSSLRARVIDVLKAVESHSRNLVDVRSPDEFTGKILAPPGLSETAQRGGHIPGAKSVPWSTARQARRHVQRRRRSAEDLPRGREGGRQSSHHRVLPHRRALEPHLVRAQVPARPQGRAQLRRLLDRVRLDDRSADREAGAAARHGLKNGRLTPHAAPAGSRARRRPTSQTLPNLLLIDRST